MARVPYMSPEGLSDADRDLVISMLEDRPKHVYQAIGHNPEVLRGLRAFLAALWGEGGLADRHRELVVMAVARELRSAYEWHQHVRIARGTHLDADEIDAIGRGALDAFDADDEAVLAYATAVAAGSVDDATHDAARAALGDDATLVAAAATAAGYAGLARLLDALGVELEPGEAFVGWTPSAAD